MNCSHLSSSSSMPEIPSFLFCSSTDVLVVIFGFAATDLVDTPSGMFQAFLEKTDSTQLRGRCDSSRGSGRAAPLLSPAL